MHAFPNPDRFLRTITGFGSEKQSNVIGFRLMRPTARKKHPNLCAYPQCRHCGLTGHWAETLSLHGNGCADESNLSEHPLAHPLGPVSRKRMDHFVPNDCREACFILSDREDAGIDGDFSSR